MRQKIKQRISRSQKVGHNLESNMGADVIRLEDWRNRKGVRVVDPNVRYLCDITVVDGKLADCVPSPSCKLYMEGDRCKYLVILKKIE
jgi:hypothetical protein